MVHYCDALLDNHVCNFLIAYYNANATCLHVAMWNTYTCNLLHTYLELIVNVVIAVMIF